MCEEMLKDVGAADQREEEAVDGAPEVGGVADVVLVALGHVPKARNHKIFKAIAAQASASARAWW